MRQFAWICQEKNHIGITTCQILTVLYIDLNAKSLYVVCAISSASEV